MTVAKRDDEARERKWLERIGNSDANHSQFNGLVIPDPILNDPRYRQIKTALPEPMRPLFEDFAKSLIYPKKSRD
jgi:hypothetical protein